MKKRSWIYEMPILFAAAWAAKQLVAPDERLEPSPLWLGPLLFGLRYGAAAGACSGAAAAVLHALDLHQGGESFRLQDTDFYALPALFVVVGGAVGFGADRWMHRVAGLESTVAELQEKVRALVNQASTQQKAMRAIEQQVVSQMSSVVTLYHGSQELGTLDRAALPGGVLAFFKAALRAEKASVYVPRDGRWVLHGGDGPADVGDGPGTMPRALREKRLVTARETDAPDALLAAPILDPSGEPAMLFAVHEMPFLRFNSAAINLAALLSEWAAESLRKCLEVEKLREGALLDDELGVHSAAYLKDRLARDKREVLLVTVTPDAAVPVARRPALLKAAARALRETGGIVARSHVAGADLAVLGPDADPAALLARLELPAKIEVRPA